MLKNKFLVLSCCLAGALVLTSCSSDKEIPQGKRIAVISPSASINPDVANGASLIKLPAAQQNLQWHQSNYNAQHVIPNIKVSEGFKKQWSASFGKGSSKREKLISRPLVHDGRIFTLDAEGQISCFNLQSGESEWYADLSPENKNAEASSLKGVGMAFENNVIYASSGYGDVYAFNAKNGKKIWTAALNFPLRTAPVVAAGKLFVQSVDNKFFALDLKDGSVLWQYDILMENTTIIGGAAAAYCPDLDVVITGFSNGELQAFNATIGTPLWSDVLVSNRQAYSSTFLNTIKASPVVEKETVYALGNGNVLAALNVRSGMRIWEKEVGGIQTPLLKGNVLYVVTKDNDLVAFNKDDGRILWAKSINLGEKPSEVTVNAPVMFNDKIILAISNGTVNVYNPKTGEMVNQISIGETINSAPIGVDGYIIFVSDNAKLAVYK